MKNGPNSKSMTDPTEQLGDASRIQTNQTKQSPNQNPLDNLNPPPLTSISPPGATQGKTKTLPFAPESHKKRILNLTSPSLLLRPCLPVSFFSRARPLGGL